MEGQPRVKILARSKNFTEKGDEFFSISKGFFFCAGGGGDFHFRREKIAGELYVNFERLLRGPVVRWHEPHCAQIVVKLTSPPTRADEWIAGRRVLVRVKSRVVWCPGLPKRSKSPAHRAPPQGRLWAGEARMLAYFRRFRRGLMPSLEGDEVEITAEYEG